MNSSNKTRNEFYNRIRKVAGCALLETKVDENELNDKIISLFSKKSPKEHDIIALSKEIKISVDDIHQCIYLLLSSFLKKIGKHNNVPDSEFDPKELEMGRKVELEHTDNKWIAELIAKDHLSEVYNYYTLLSQMEKQAKDGKKRISIVNTEPDTNKEGNHKSE